jgi:hypothetical protein
MLLDLAYIALTFAFFALQFAYIRGCDVLGRRSESEDRTS